MDIEVDHAIGRLERRARGGEDRLAVELVAFGRGGQQVQVLAR